ncbi:MAG: CoB--CoM heterodisulfide reductase iron-sulfur subunit B family protein [Planctomycetota bacterium]|nr:CoB--CoM heterodisulfide reductase iron-sulfur subunit B family protein [Nitrospirota bacterium]
MRYAFYLGCATPVKALKYEISTRNLAKILGIELVDIPEFSCCGFPVKSMDSFAALLMAARNLAIAEEKGMDIIGVCTGCMAILSEAKEYLEDEKLRDKVNEKLKAIGAKEYTGRVKVKHFARFLYEDYRLDRIRDKIVTPLASLEFGIHYGCHYMKPTHAHGHFDDPSNPFTIDGLINITGAKTINYPNKNLCCGLTIMGTAEDISFRLAAEKLEYLSSRGVDAMVVACPSCCIAYENNQKLVGKRVGKEFNLPVLYFTQVIGLAMGLSEKDLGFEFNRIKADKITEKFK